LNILEAVCSVSCSRQTERGWDTVHIVIGGSGFIGSHVVKSLIDQGEKVRVFDLHEFPRDEEVTPHEMFLGNILDFSALQAAMDGCDTVFHLAANPQLWNRDSAVFDQVNRQGTENVLKAAQQAGVRRLVYTSTESILARRSLNETITEEAEPLESEIIGPYCRSKYLAEKAVFREAKKGFPAIVVCPTMPIGPGDRNLTPPGKMIVDFLRKKIPCYINCTLNFVDVRDVARGHVLAAEKGEPCRRYIFSGYNLTLAEFFSYLSMASGKPAPTIKIPYFIALLWSYMEEWIGSKFGRLPQSSVTGVKLCKRSLAFNGSRTWHQLGHEPRSLEESVRDAVSWHLKYNLPRRG
jgi:dihydroflavonol-4-reductase